MKTKIMITLFLGGLAAMLSACDKDQADPIPAPLPGLPFQSTVSTFAGQPGQTGYVDAVGANARFNGPAQMVYDHRNNMLYVADQGFNGLVVRAVDMSGEVSTYVEQDLDAFESIGDLCLAPGPAGSLYMSSITEDALFSVSPAGNGKGIVNRIAGFNGSGNADGDLQTASFDGPRGCIADVAGRLYVGNDYYNTIKKVDLQADQVSALAGKPAEVVLEPGGFRDGAGQEAEFSGLHDLAISPDGSFLIVPDYDNNAMRKVDLRTRKVTTLFGAPLPGIDTDGPFAEAQAGNPEVAVCAGNGNIFFSSFVPGFSGGSKVRVAMPDSGMVYTVAGGTGTVKFKDGPGPEARFNGIQGIAVSPDGKTLFVSDRENHCIRKIELEFGR